MNAPIRSNKPEEVYGRGPEINPGTYFMGDEGNYVCLVNEKTTITLDGEFTRKELEHFLSLMPNAEP